MTLRTAFCPPVVCSAFSLHFPGTRHPQGGPKGCWALIRTLGGRTQSHRQAGPLLSSPFYRWQSRGTDNSRLTQSPSSRAAGLGLRPGLPNPKAFHLSLSFQVPLDSSAPQSLEHQAPQVPPSQGPAPSVFVPPSPAPRAPCKGIATPMRNSGVAGPSSDISSCLAAVWLSWAPQMLFTNKSLRIYSKVDGA